MDEIKRLQCEKILPPPSKDGAMLAAPATTIKPPLILQHGLSTVLKQLHNSSSTTSSANPHSTSSPVKLAETVCQKLSNRTSPTEEFFK